MKYPEILSASAACRGEDPTLFDWSHDRMRISLALSICDSCLVKRACQDFVRPARSFHDGVVAGFLWRNGRKVEEMDDMDAALDLDDDSPIDVRYHRSRVVPSVSEGGVLRESGFVSDGAEDGR